MTKPIFVARLNREYLNRDNEDVIEALGKELYDYHVLVVPADQDSHSFECYNDCKGSPDIDIENLIKSLK